MACFWSLPEAVRASGADDCVRLMPSAFRISGHGRCADGHGPADHVADEITAAGGEVPLPDDPDLSPGQLEDLLARSHAGEPKEFRVSVDAFHDLMDGEAQ